MCLKDEKDKTTEINNCVSVKIKEGNNKTIQRINRKKYAKLFYSETRVICAMMFLVSGVLYFRLNSK